MQTLTVNRPHSWRLTQTQVLRVDKAQVWQSLISIAVCYGKDRILCFIGTYTFSPLSSNTYYRPQRSWGKVMFLQASVILLTRGGLPQYMLGYHTPWSRHPPPGAEHAGRYGQRTGGTHTTGVQSCIKCYLPIAALFRCLHLYNESPYFNSLT